MQGKNLKEDFINSKKKELRDKEKAKNIKYTELETCRKELKALKEEVVKSLLGNSQFSAEIIKELLFEKEKALLNINTELDDILKQIDSLKYDLNSYVELDQELFDWNERFDIADDELKKAMLSSIVEKVVVYKDSVELQFNLKVKTYKANLPESNVHGSQSVILPW